MTELAASHETGALQPDGTIKPEGTMNVQHVADAIVHIASLPLNVTVLTFNIMCVCLRRPGICAYSRFPHYRATTMPFVGRG